jgi:hypothetical protein
MNAVAAPKIEIGRRVWFFAGYGGTDGEGLIVAIHGEVNPEPAQSIFRGVGRVIRPNDCTVDVILFDGRRKLGVHQCGIDAPGIGIKLLDRVHGVALVEKARELAAEREAREVIERAQARQRFEENEAAREIADAPLFYWNGIKDAKGEKLQRAFYWPTTSQDVPAGTITVCARDYCRFSDKVRAAFLVTNDSDVMTDYFAEDTFKVIPSHPLYLQVKAALEACNDHSTKRVAKRNGGAA